ncbi:formamidopyrimidine-DNA glycosylase [Mucilaginibacter gracilis]|uniref:Formamidopyrimidine-DNA glycosylase n=1 Tax=Mucilaginibacter gracilis TaxID=423350 RepID=A0A495J5V6_9SPHI|nr:DNA-formamidopyrimidine glycosylase family protein [Mucilaginibacter gracilis]RKR84376.1 formamidopyrimidine-DNA glycosylase [Mucilaginibacter gracilis]
MPELPDLQAFSHNLNKKFKGKILKQVTVPVDKKLNVLVAQLQAALQHQQLTQIKRVGKELHFEFKNGHVLGLHLMLHGTLHVFTGHNDGKFAIIELLFADGTGLAMSDFQKAATPTLDPKASDTPDALDIEPAYLIEKLRATRKPIKTVLLDQQVLRGIGNAYADEILYDAKISPLSISNKLPEIQVTALITAITKVLKDAEKQILKAKPDIISGEVRDFLLVHQPKREQTPGGATIHHTEINSRRTYYTDEQQLFE